MSSKEREYHIVMVTNSSFYDACLMKTSWPVSMHDVNRCTRISIKASFPFY